jgi:Protein of unknown function (DUF2384)
MVDFRPDMDHVQIWTTKEPIVPQRAPNAENSIDAGPDHLDPRRFDPANRRRLSAPGLRTFLAIAALWGLTEEERRCILGGPPRSTYQNWVKTVREHHEITLSADVLTRISAVLGIHQALGILFDGEQAGVAWLRGPHRATVFGNSPPMDLVTSGTQDGLLTVRRFLDAARGGHYMSPNEIDAGFRPYTDADIVFS